MYLENKNFSLVMFAFRCKVQKKFKAVLKTAIFLFHLIVLIVLNYLFFIGFFNKNSIIVIIYFEKNKEKCVVVTGQKIFDYF